jgi:hypothetical protein
MKDAFRIKFVSALRGLKALGVLLRRATRSVPRGCTNLTNMELQALKRLAKSVSTWSLRSVGGNAADLDDLLGELALCHDPIAEDI